MSPADRAIPDVNTTASVNHVMQRYRPNPDVVAQKLRDETVLVHVRTNRIYRLNGTGSAIWELLVAGEDVLMIQKCLHGAYAVDPSTLGGQVELLLAALKRETLIVLDGGV